MKIRNGFVSNSSSSSFLVAFPRPVESAEDLQDFLFKSKESFDYDGHTYSAAEVVDALYSEKMMPLTFEELRTEIEGGWFPGMPDYPFCDLHAPENEQKRIQDAYRDKFERFMDARYREFLEQTPGSVYYRFSVGDNHGDVIGALGAALENGDVWDEILHIRCNNH